MMRKDMLLTSSVKQTLIWALGLCLLQACGSKDDNNTSGEANGQTSQEVSTPLFTSLDASTTGIDFTNVLEETEDMNILTYQYLYNGAGVSVGDLNNDGLPEVFFSANNGQSKLFLNKGGLQFEDISQASGVVTSNWCTGTVMADVNGDGYLDIYVVRSNKVGGPEARANLLFINNGDLTFTEQAAAYGLADEGYGTHTTFFDMDRDGDLDAFIINHGVDFDSKVLDREKEMAKAGKYDSHRLYRNDGETFTDITAEAGVLSYAFGLSVNVCDINEDNWPDLYVCNDYTMPDFLYINNKNGTFSESLADYVKHHSMFAMGSDVSDINNDGLEDILVMDMLPEDGKREKMLLGPVNYDKFMFTKNQGYGYQYMQNCLQVNNGNGSFSEVAELSGIAKTDWSWAPLLADFDNDGYKDLYVTNGYRRDFTDQDYIMYRSEQMSKRNGIQDVSLAMVEQMPEVKLQNYFYRNTGNLNFENVSNEWGIKEETFSNGAAYADLDGDGDLDVLVNNINDPALVYRNNIIESKKDNTNYLQLKLEGYAKNTFGVGTKVKVQSKQGSQYQQAIPAKGYQSSVSNVLHFGLGDQASDVTVDVVWPDGRSQQLTGVAANQVLTVKHSQASEGGTVQETSSNDLLFSEVTGEKGLVFKHTENVFVDFKREPLLPHMHSKNGSGIAVGDVDGDGREDFFIGAPALELGLLFKQQANGSFKGSYAGQGWKQDNENEDMGSLLFDADNDGDLDLYVVSGGSEADGYHNYYQDRLYLNNGQGVFSKAVDALPTIRSSGSCVVGGDYDQDGDIDLFVGGRLGAGSYPFSTRSYILQNNGGTFTDVTKQVSAELEYPGLVTAALWTDFNGDKALDLIVVGEWMPIKLYQNQGGRLVNVSNTAGLTQTGGWWNSIVSGDFDEDGDLDYVVGNLGLNSKLKASPSKPASIVAKDFDGNGSKDAIISYYYPNGVSYPIHSRDELLDQMTYLKKRLLRYEDYAGKTINEVFTPEELQGSYKREAHLFTTSLIRNMGNGKFQIEALPNEAQLSTVNGMLVQDYNGDGHLDVLLTGNLFTTQVQIGRYDAAIGLLLTGQGDGSFTPVRVTESGFFTPEDAKGMATLPVVNQGRQLIVVANNNGYMQSFEHEFNGATIQVNADEYRLILDMENGKKIVSEVYYGSGYLSSTSRKLIAPVGVTKVTAINYKGESREVPLSGAGQAAQ